jgi:hypothetical protein
MRVDALSHAAWHPPVSSKRNAAISFGLTNLAGHFAITAKMAEPEQTLYGFSREITLISSNHYIEDGKLA